MSTKYICSTCGYVYDGEDFTKEPDDYICPLCDSEKSEFKERSFEHEVNLATNEYHHVVQDKESEKESV